MGVGNGGNCNNNDNGLDLGIGTIPETDIFTNYISDRDDINTVMSGQIGRTDQNKNDYNSGGYNNHNNNNINGKRYRRDNINFRRGNNHGI